MSDINDFQKAYLKAKRALAFLEEQAAGYTSLSIPVNLKIEIEDKRYEIIDLENNIKQNQEDDSSNLAQLTTVQEGLLADKDVFKSIRLKIQEGETRYEIGVPPLALNGFFRDRHEAYETILNFISDNSFHKAITIYGKGGVGKTALACEVMGHLKKNININGKIYLSSRSQLGINLEQIYLSFSSLLGGELENLLIQTWVDKEKSVTTKIDILIDHLRERKFILLLDNLEDLLDDSGKIKEVHLSEFLNLFLRRSHLTKIIITTRERLSIENDARVFMDFLPLDTGLPIDDSILLLQSFDGDGYLRIKNSPHDILKLLAQKTLGYPKALEAIAGILDQDPFLLPSEIAQNDTIFDGAVIEVLVGEAQERLSQEARYVMQSLAIFNRPVTINAIKFLLEPFVEIDSLDIIVAKLVRGKFIHINNNKEIVIHPLDRIFNYRHIPG